MLPSGNDAAIALAEYMGKYYTSSESSYNEFLNQMNDHACLLGMTNTHYKNPHGLSYTRNLSTAFDVCKVA